MNGHAETHGQFCPHHAAIRYDTADGRTLKTIKGFKMEDRETRRKIIRQWMLLPKDKRQTRQQAVDFAKKAVEQYELPPSRRDPYQRVVGWLLPRTGK